MCGLAPTPPPPDCLLSSVCRFFVVCACVFPCSFRAARSQIVFEVKPWEAESDLKGLFEKIRKVRRMYVCVRVYVYICVDIHIYV